MSAVYVFFSIGSENGVPNNRKKRRKWIKFFLKKEKRQIVSYMCVRRKYCLSFVKKVMEWIPFHRQKQWRPTYNEEWKFRSEQKEYNQINKNVLRSC